MCILVRRVVRQLTQMTKTSCRDNYTLDEQIKDVFRTVFYYRLNNNNWTGPAEDKVSMLLDENDSKLHDAYMWRVACDQGLSDNAKMMLSVGTFLVDDFPHNTLRLRQAVRWAYDLHEHRCSNTWNGEDPYNWEWNDPCEQPMFDLSKLPNKHGFWESWDDMYWARFTDTYFLELPELTEQEMREEREEEEKIKKMEGEGRKQRERKEQRKREDEEEQRKREEERSREREKMKPEPDL